MCHETFSSSMYVLSLSVCSNLDFSPHHIIVNNQVPARGARRIQYSISLSVYGSRLVTDSRFMTLFSSLSTQIHLSSRRRLAQILRREGHGREQVLGNELGPDGVAAIVWVHAVPAEDVARRQ